MKRYIRSSSVSEMSRLERVKLAKSSNDPEILAELADDEDDYVRKLVSARTDDREILAKLADDKYPGVRWEVAHRITDPKILAKLADDDDFSVRHMAATRIDDPEILAKLADDEFEGVRQAVAERTNDPELLAKFADDEYWSVRAAAAKRIDDPEILAKLADDEDFSVRNAARTRLDGHKEAEAKKSHWPSSDWWYDLDDESFEDAWQEYLSGPEDAVNKELQIFPEPSVQGSMGGLFVFDESSEDRKGEDEDWYVDWQDYLNWQIDAAATSKNASQYKEKYRSFMKNLCGI